MDELKLIIETVANLPTLTAWVLCGYLIYKLSIVGSIYGLIRYAIHKFVEWRTLPPPPPPPIMYKLNGMNAINEEVALSIVAQLQRLSTTGYIHASDVHKLRMALDYVEAQRKKENA